MFHLPPSTSCRLPPLPPPRLPLAIITASNYSPLDLTALAADSWFRPATGPAR
jgi:hypothetical protein